jgi:transposase
MSKVIMIGCDLHDEWMRLRIAADSGKPVSKSFKTVEVPAMIAWTKDFASRHDGLRIVFAYEASGQGFGLYDALRDAGMECHVLAPTHLPHTTHGRKNKTDEKDAQMILEEVRAHVLAGRKLPTVWVPDPLTRDDREVVRMRLQLSEARTRVKNQIRNQAKRCQLSLPTWFTKGGGNWSQRSVQWLRDVTARSIAGVADGIRVALGSLLDLYQEYTRQLKLLDRAVAKLAATVRYAKAFRKLKLLEGVGSLTAMVFLTELGDLARFANRRQLAAYLGLAPAAFESGKRDDRKGHITRQGPARVRHVLCQAAWAALRVSADWRKTYDRIRRDSRKRSKVAIVAVMRRLAISMWHTARSPGLDELLDEIDQHRTSAWARQKGSAPSPFAVASAGAG